MEILRILPYVGFAFALFILGGVLTLVLARALGPRSLQRPRRAVVIPGAPEPEARAREVLRAETVQHAARVLREGLKAEGRSISKREAEAEARRILEAAFHGGEL